MTKRKEKFNVRERAAARLAATQALYAFDYDNSADSNQTLTKFLDYHSQEQANKFKIDLIYFKRLYSNTIQSLDYIDRLIKTHIDREFERLDPVVKAILRYSTYELLFENIDGPIVINEAVKLTKEIGSDGSYTLVNSYLDKLNKTKEKEKASFNTFHDENSSTEKEQDPDDLSL